MNIFILYLITGSIGGFIGGLLGLGGGIIFVPFLFFIFTHFEIHSSNIMQSAVSTSLVCVIISSFSAAIKHNKNKLINWNIFKLMLPGLAIGSIVGVSLITLLSSDLIKIYYGILLIIIAIYLLIEVDDTKKIIKKNFKYINIFSIFTSSISTLLGIGGGTLTTPYFKYYGESMKTSIATASACGVPIALLGIIATLVINLFFNIFDKTVLDFIDYYAFILISSSTLIFSYLGASLSFVTKINILKNLFSLALLIIGIAILNF